ncbi:MAG: hypothetical protein Q9172_005196 [Xanthocarpia lactea]
MFSNLSAEVRLKIWRHFMPSEYDDIPGDTDLWEPYQSSPSNALAIMRTNRAIHAEVSYELYRHRTLRFIIHPHANRWRPMGIKARPWQLRHTNFTKFKKLQINIIAPELADRGQVHQLRDSSIDLVSVLSSDKMDLGCDNLVYSTFRQQKALYDVVEACVSSSRQTLIELPPVEVAFHDHGQTLWTRDRMTPKRSEEKAENFRSSSVLLYPFILLKAFCRGGVEVSVYNNEGQPVPESKMAMEEFLQCAPVTSGWITRQHQISLKLEGVLDTLEGPTANRLRLLRYRDFGRYTWWIESFLCNEVDKTWDDFPNVCLSFVERYRTYIQLSKSL